MKKSEDLYYFIILIFILIIGLTALFWTRGYQTLQLIISIITATAYVIWGVFYHAHRRDLHPRIVIEYILVALIAVILLVTIAI